MCNDGFDNDAVDTTGFFKGFIDSDDPNCCDKCNGSLKFDNILGYNNFFGISCGNLSFSDWEKSSNGLYLGFCCGDDAGEYYKVNQQNSSVVACCNTTNDCVDSFDKKCQSGTEQSAVECGNGKDDDCDGLIDISDDNCTGIVHGTILDETNYGIRKAIIKYDPPGSNAPIQTISNYIGEYSISLPVGRDVVLARAGGYDDNVTNVTVVSKAIMPLGVALNISLKNGSCHADCSDSYGNCNIACDGVSFRINDTANDTCQFINPICDTRPKGYRASYNDNGTIHAFLCCEGKDEPGWPGVQNYTAQKTQISGNMSAMYDDVTIVKLHGRMARMHILYWKK